MVLECLTWIPCICGQLISAFIFSKKGSIRALPDDVTVNILSRLPADCVLECRRVCRKWRALTSSAYFAELHIKRATNATAPSFFVHWLERSKLVKQGQLNFFIYDNNDDGRRRSRIITKILPSSGKAMYHYGARVLGSCDGLLIFLATKKAPTVFVFNPVTQDLVILPVPFRHATTCGIYFHPSTCEYKVLLCIFKEGNDNHLKTYYTSSLKSKVWKKLDYLSNCKTRTIHPAILLNGSLHWMVNRNEEVEEEKYDRPCTDAILAFDTETEDFRLLPHPGDSSCYYCPEEHENMYLLLGTRDRLYLCHVTWGEVINVWVLEDYAGWAWTRRYKVNLDWDVKRFPFTADYSGIYDPKDVRVLGIHNDELMIDWVSRGLFSYHLVKNTVTHVPISLEVFHYPIPYATAYYKSLVRLE